MKKTFTKQEILDNRGCYSEEQVNNLSFINKGEITLVDIMESEISIKDKRWFLFNNAELKLNQKKELAFVLAKGVVEIYNNKYPNDIRVNVCLQAIQDFNIGMISRVELLVKRRAAEAAYAAADAAAEAADAADAAEAEAAYAAADAAEAAYAAADAAEAADAADAAEAAANAADAADAAYAAGKQTYSQRLQLLLIDFINENIEQ